MVLHPGIDALVFTGSYGPATRPRPAQGPPQPPRGLADRRQGHRIVPDDAELDRAVYEVMVGVFLTSGQRHNSTGRVIVTEGIFDQFIELLVRRTNRLRVGYGFDDDVFLGPPISEASAPDTADTVGYCIARPHP